ncbi:hypothetical protein B0H63DRAFT_528624 [Podospora didyma]|uniref:Heterokaryon incompatibility domain-containing protein n=1 Tax=Podospora didyma TaxID=330526 RepID=A0AAE0K248_9PEZI|nr:hypothetical protein B0H63DRAFT_528624 [Podospora didyma]
MDFLPHPSSGGVDPLDVPFLADTPYVYGSDFWDFPKTHGFGDQWTTLPVKKLASLIQSWLYFGVISEFLGRPIDYQRFNVAGSVSGKPLLPLLDEWLDAHVVPGLHHVASSPAAAREKDDLKQLLYNRARFLDEVFHLAEDLEKLSSGGVRPIPPIILSVKILCVSLHGVIREFIEGQAENDKSPIRWPPTGTRRLNGIIPPPPPSDSTAVPQTLPSVQLLRDVLRLRGWCPFYIRKIISTCNYAMVYYCSRLFKRYSPDLGHERCSEDECVASNVDLGDYRSRHTDSSCTCRPLSVRADKLRAIVQSGGVPVVRVTTVKRKLVVKVTCMSTKTRFVAISHVWSDGLGNSKTNSLPKCQLRRLQDYIDKLKPLRKTSGTDGCFGILSSSPETGFQTSLTLRPKYFWMDTLCIPAGGPADDARSRAVNKVPAVFKAADRVLILDSSLEQMSLANTDACERLARLSASRWSSRCWTYQDAALGSHCEIQCADGTFDLFSQQPDYPLHQSQQQQKSTSKWLAFPIPEIINKESHRLLTGPKQSQNDGTTMSVDANTVMRAGLARPIARDLQLAFGNSPKRSTDLDDGWDEALRTDLCTLFVRAWNELGKRSTTIPYDTHIMMATLLGFNAQPIMRLAKPEDRMSAILWSMDGIPMSLFFNKKGPRHHPAGKHRDRWVPLYPSKQRLSLGSTYTNLRAINGDLYLPNNSSSRREVSVLICTEQPEPGLKSIFTVWDASAGKRFSVEIHREGGDSDAFAAPEIGPFCIVIQLNTDLDQKQKTMPGALFRIRRVVTNVQKWYHHNLETEYVNSFELVEAEEPAVCQYNIPEKETTTDSAETGDLAAAFGKHERGILRAVYDCPLTVSYRTEDIKAEKDEKRAPAMNPIPLPNTWQVVIERETPSFSVPLPSRPSFSDAIAPVSSYFLVTALDGLVASGSFGLAIAICSTMFSQLALMAKVALMAKLGLHSLLLVQMFMFSGLEPRLVWDVLHIALVILYTVSRAAGGEMGILDYAFIAWSLVGHSIDFAARLGIQWRVVPKLFDQYIASFDPDDFVPGYLYDKRCSVRLPPVAALTSIWTPPCGSGSWFRPAFATRTTDNVAVSCPPPNWSAYWRGSNGIGYYSPAICPSGLTIGCTRWAGDFHGPETLPGEEAWLCVQSGYTCSPTDEFLAAYSRTTSGTVTGWATCPLLQIRWQLSDLSILETHPLTSGHTLAPRTTSTTGWGFGPTSTAGSQSTLQPASKQPPMNNSGNLTDGAKAGIGAGIVGAFLLGFALGFIFIRRRRGSKTKPIPGGRGSGEEEGGRHGDARHHNGSQFDEMKHYGVQEYGGEGQGNAGLGNLPTEIKPEIHGMPLSEADSNVAPSELPAEYAHSGSPIASPGLSQPREKTPL